VSSIGAEPERALRRTGIEVCAHALQRSRDATASFAPVFAARSARSSARSVVARSARRELGVDGLDVRARIDAAAHVDDVGVLEAAHDVRDRVRLADVSEELVCRVPRRAAPATRPAMSTYSTAAGTTFAASRFPR
jgi:hypothetical protein